MRSAVFAAALVLSALLDGSFIDVLAIGGVRPWCFPVLLAFVCFNASKPAARWAALAMGISYDLLSPAALPGGAALVVIGPHTLGCLLAAGVAIPIRGVVFKRNPVAVALLSGALLVIHQIGWFAMWTVRGWLGDPVPWVPGEVGATMLWSTLASVPTAVIGIPVCMLLERFESVWGFPAIGSTARRV